MGAGPSPHIYIAANLKNCVALLDGFWVAALLDLTEKIGRDRVYVSIYESGSNDATPARANLSCSSSTAAATITSSSNGI